MPSLSQWLGKNGDCVVLSAERIWSITSSSPMRASLNDLIRKNVKPTPSSPMNPISAFELIFGNILRRVIIISVPSMPAITT